MAAQDPVTAQQLSRSNARLLSRQGGSVSLTTQGSPRDLLSFFFKIFFKRWEGREKERERKINVWLPLTWLPLGTSSATLECAPTGN